jgi:hypothetical protein
LAKQMKLKEQEAHASDHEEGEADQAAPQRALVGRIGRQPLARDLLDARRCYRLVAAKAA